MINFEQSRGNYLISTNPEKLDIKMIHRFLTNSYWAESIPIELVERSIRHSLCFGVFIEERQIGFARVISDYATFAYIGDVFILSPYRGQGLAHWLIETVLAHPELQGLRRISLATRDAHKLYEKSGFTLLKTPERHMEKTDPDVYKR